MKCESVNSTRFIHVSDCSKDLKVARRVKASMTLTTKNIISSHYFSKKLKSVLFRV